MRSTPHRARLAAGPTRVRRALCAAGRFASRSHASVCAFWAAVWELHAATVDAVEATKDTRLRRTRDGMSVATIIAAERDMAGFAETTRQEFVRMYERAHKEPFPRVEGARAGHLDLFAGATWTASRRPLPIRLPPMRVGPTQEHRARQYPPGIRFYHQDRIESFVRSLEVDPELWRVVAGAVSDSNLKWWRDGAIAEARAAQRYRRHHHPGAARRRV
jgi:hypothetical protein